MLLVGMAGGTPREAQQLVDALVNRGNMILLSSLEHAESVFNGIDEKQGGGIALVVKVNNDAQADRIRVRGVMVHIVSDSSPIASGLTKCIGDYTIQSYSSEEDLINNIKSFIKMAL